MRKSGSYIAKKIIAIFQQFFLRFLLHFGAHGAPKNCSFFMKICSWSRFCGILAPGGCPKRSKMVSDTIFSWIWYNFGTISSGIFYLFSFVCNIISYSSPLQRYTNTPNNTDIPIYQLYIDNASILHWWYIDTPIHRHTDTHKHRYADTSLHW